MQPSKPAPYLATFALLSLSLAVPMLVWSVGQAAGNAAEPILAAVLVIAGARFSWILFTRERHLHEMVLWLFVYLFMGVAPLLQFRLRFPGTTPDLALELAPTAAWIVLLGSVSIILGSSLAARKGAHTSPEHMRRPRLRIQATTTYWWTSIALILASVYISRVGIGALFSSRSALKLSLIDSSDPLNTLIGAGAKMGLVVAFVALMCLRAARKDSGESRPFFLPVLVLIVLLMVVNPISSARYTFGTAALAILGAFGAYATIRRFRIVSVAALLGITFAFPLLDTFRRTLDATVQLENPLTSMTTGDFDAFAQIVNTVHYTNTLGITWGRQLSGVLFFWVPRSAWPDKPIDTGAALGEFRGYGFTNLSAPLWAEFFINFGWVGLVLGMLLFGFMLRKLDQSAELALISSPIPGVLACITPFFMLILLRGSLLQAMVNLFVILGASWFVTRDFARRGKTRVTPTKREEKAAMGRNP